MVGPEYPGEGASININSRAHFKEFSCTELKEVEFNGKLADRISSSHSQKLNTYWKIIKLADRIFIFQGHDKTKL